MLLQGCRAPQDVFAVMCLWFPNETDLNKAEAGETWVLTQAPLPTSDPLPELPISPPAEPGWPILRPLSLASVACAVQAVSGTAPSKTRASKAEV